MIEARDLPAEVIEEILESQPLPQIFLSEERRPQLQAKLSEYTARLAKEDEFAHPDLMLLRQSDAAYKRAVLDRVLAEGSLDPILFRVEMQEKTGTSFDLGTFVNAILVIHDYCQTGGSRATGGTGLPKVQ